MIARSNDLAECQTAPERSCGMANAPRVLHVINGEDYSGAERVQDLLALRLPELGFEVGFACVKPGRFAAERRSADTPLANFPMRSKADLKPAWKLARFIKREGYTLLHAHSPRAALIARAAAALTSVPLVYHVHSPTTVDSAHALRNLFNTCIERVCLSGVSAVIACSESMGRYICAQRVADDRVYVVPNGVPTCEYLVERPYPTRPWRLGTLALFRPRKGLDVLLSALAILRRDGIEVRLRATGDFQTSEYRAEIDEQLQRLQLHDAVELPGFRSDVPAELGQMDLFVLPSLYGEGLPMVVLEAMAAGVPVISTQVEGIPEAVRDGIDGLIVPPGDAAALAAAIQSIINGELNWHGLRESAYERQQRHYSDHSMAAGVARVYRDVLGIQASVKSCAARNAGLVASATTEPLSV